MKTAFKKAMAFVVFDNIVDGSPALTADELSELAVALPIVDLGAQSPLSTFSHGFVNPFDVMSPATSDTDHAFEQYAVFAYRFDRKNIQPDVLAVEARKITDKLRADNNGAPLSKQEELSAIEQARMRLLPSTPVKSKTGLIILDTVRNFIVFGGFSAKELDIVVDNIKRRNDTFAYSQALSGAELATLMRGENYAKSMEALNEVLDKNVPVELSATSELLLWLWFVSETFVKDGASIPFKHNPMFVMSVVSDTLKVGNIVDDCKAVDVIVSKEENHGHIRYALWKDKMTALEAKFAVAMADIGGVRVSMNALNPHFIGIDAGSIYNNKDINRKFKTPNKFCTADVFSDANLRAAYDIFLSEKLSAQESACFDYIASVITAITCLAFAAELYITARAVPARWSGTEAKITEWLMAYVPECERVQAIQDGAE